MDSDAPGAGGAPPPADGSPLLGLKEIEARVTTLARVIHGTGDSMPTYGVSMDFARPYIVVDADGYHYIIEERGRELKHLVTRSLDELLETIFVAVTHDLAGRYEVVHRVRGKDARRLMFARHLELLDKLSPVWAQRQAQRQEQILVKYPFRDR